MVTKEMIKKEYIELRDTYLKIAVLFRQIQDKSTTKYKKGFAIDYCHSFLTEFEIRAKYLQKALDEERFDLNTIRQVHMSCCTIFRAYESVYDYTTEHEEIERLLKRIEQGLANTNVFIKELEQEENNKNLV